MICKRSCSYIEAILFVLVPEPGIIAVIGGFSPIKLIIMNIIEKHSMVKNSRKEEYDIPQRLLLLLLGWQGCFNVITSSFTIHLVQGRKDHLWFQYSPKQCLNHGYHGP